MLVKADPRKKAVCYVMWEGDPRPVLPWEDQFSRQRQARNITPHIGSQVELPGQNVEGIVSWLCGHFHHDIAVEDVG